ncbi:MAG: hypothetical protein JJE29_04150 [Peptostreptococcaceae bacterium]|nr:hypothetical protein [Peptostreptococcaceae bacterium]
MITVLSQKCIEKADIASFLSFNPDGYVHIEPSIKNVNIIDLGLGKDTVNKVACKNYSVNVFNKSFNPELMLSLKSDCIVVTNGIVDAKEYEKIKANLIKMIGKKKIVGFGLGKKILADSAEQMDVIFDASSKLYGSENFEMEMI